MNCSGSDIWSGLPRILLWANHERGTEDVIQQAKANNFQGVAFIKRKLWSSLWVVFCETHRQTKDYAGYFPQISWESIPRNPSPDSLVAARITSLRPICIRDTILITLLLATPKEEITSEKAGSRKLTSGSLPSDTKFRALHPSEPIHEKAPVALLRRTALITPATSWSDPKMMAPKTNLLSEYPCKSSYLDKFRVF